MNRSDVRRGVEATVEPLSEITRAAVWQRIEDQLSTPVRRSRGVPMATFAAGAAGGGGGGAGGGGGKAGRGEGRGVGGGAAAEYPRAFAGGELTVYGPGELELNPTPDRPVLRIERGTVIVRRAPDLPLLHVITPEWSRNVQDAVV